LSKTTALKRDQRFQGQEGHAFMRPVPFSNNPDNNGPGLSRDEADVAIVNETIRILTDRGNFNEAAFHDYVADSRTLVALPDEITLEWVRATAERIPDEFALWMAGDRQ
jgi:hypothetical protein